MNGSALITVTVSPVGDPAPEIDSLTDDITITSGESVTIEWTTSNALSAQFNGSNVSVDGSQSVSPTSTTTYTLVAYENDEDNQDTGRSDSESVTVTVGDPPPTPAPVVDSFVADPDTIESGESTTLRWMTSNALEVRINGQIVNIDGTLSRSPTTDRTYTLIAYEFTGQGGRSDSESVTVTVTEVPEDPDPVIDSFSRSPATIIIGQSVTLTWTSTNGLSASINQGVGDVSVNGSTTDTPTSTGTKTYTLTVWRDAGKSGPSVSQSVSVEVLTPAPVIDSFVTDPSTITSGDSTTLRWTTSNALSLTLSNQDFPVDGSFSVSPTSTRTYFIRAYENADKTGRSVGASVTVTVVPPPVIDSFSASSTSIQAGDSVILSWETTDATSVSLGSSSVSLDGDSTVTPSVTITYVLRATNAAGTTVTRSITITVTSGVDPTIDSFSADQNTLVLIPPDTSASTVLRWTTTDALSVRLDGNDVSVDGSQQIEISQTTSYTLVAYETSTYGGNTATRTITVTVQ